MMVMAIIEDAYELAKIVEWAKHQEHAMFNKPVPVHRLNWRYCRYKLLKLSLMRNKISSLKRCLYGAMGELWCQGYAEPG
jgi:hypothetical protein